VIVYIGSSSLELLAVSGGAVTWLVANFMAVSRRPAQAVLAYRLSGFFQALLAADAGALLHVSAWFWLAGGWLVGKVVVVPWLLSRALPPSAYEVKAPATPRLVMGSALLVSVCTWAVGVPGLFLGTLLTPFWLLTQRRELWIQAVLLMEAEIALGFLSMALATVGASDFMALALLVAMGGLLAWLYRRGAEDVPSPSTDRLTNLKG
jgi:hydrogenase-4 membrane subunit HyfE